MKRKNEWLGLGLFVAVISTALVAFAVSRNVTIFAENGTVDLQNGSTVGVNYNVHCFDKGGVSIGVLTNQNLGPKLSASFPTIPKCGSSNASSYGSWSNGMKEGCSNFINYDLAALNAACPTNYTVCTHNQYIANHSNNGYKHYVNFEALTWTTNASNWQWGFGNPTNNNAFGDKPVATTNANNKCVLNGSTITHCTRQYSNNSSRAACCPVPGTPQLVGNISSCAITINSGDPAGYLQSPQFKSGSPF